MLTQLPHLPAASANALTGTRTLGAAPCPGKAAHRKAANELHAHNSPEVTGCGSLQCLASHLYPAQSPPRPSRQAHRPKPSVVFPGPWQIAPSSRACPAPRSCRRSRGLRPSRLPGTSSQLRPGSSRGRHDGRSGYSQVRGASVARRSRVREMRRGRGKQE